jgi:hypothetical protein
VTSAGRFVEYVWPMMTASQRCSSRMMNLIKQMRHFFKLLLDIEVLSSPSIESFWAINAAVKRVRRRLLLVRIGHYGIRLPSTSSDERNSANKGPHVRNWPLSDLPCVAQHCF